jgi:hypothetical protein
MLSDYFYAAVHAKHCMGELLTAIHLKRRAIQTRERICIGLVLGSLTA